MVKHRAANGSGSSSSALPSLGPGSQDPGPGSQDPGRIASRVSSGMPSHLAYSAQQSSSAAPGRRQGVADRATDERYQSSRRDRHAAAAAAEPRRSDLKGALEARSGHGRRQPSTTTSSASYGAREPAPAPQESVNDFVSREQRRLEREKSVAATPPRRSGHSSSYATRESPALSSAVPTRPASSSKRAPAPAPGRQQAPAPAPAAVDSKGKKLCCDACDGPHLTAECPLYKGKSRDRHKDGAKGTSKGLGSGTGAFFS